ncbi:four-carbon acid sugar kinase family protein [Leucobacter rhizosphaerae]|uniref:Four-carbon acid sugar kinase family protein n=1 Tax=Leucobacter rhizosphaerae TaxID=2932245 RepID=A0ABY4FSR0_9MICO|nr:four-carbon acid sugar kinase family protein [Leucobacter rhizosphaerae]UOQ59331.1 four-carbon acid sugar kinase family protein [Leucobacter rhizosphaerae]
MTSFSNPVLVIADDLTGANAAGARFARAGLRSATVTWSGLTGGLPGFDALIVTTDSRHLPHEEAAERVATAIRRSPGSALVVKRIDTTLRGNIGAELEAALTAVRAAHPGDRVRALLVPAFPTSGRTTVDGVQLLNGKPLERTELRDDVHNPMTTSVVAEIVGQQSALTTRHLSLRHVVGEQLADQLAAGDEDLLICDATDDHHIEAIAAAAAAVSEQTGIRWVTVDPGPFGALLAQAAGLGSARAEEPPLVALLGSVTELSIAQADYLARSELVTVVEVDALELAGERAGSEAPADPVAALSERIEGALTSVAFPQQVLVRVQPPATGGYLSAAGRERLPELLAEVLLRAVERVPVSGLYSSGGDITAAILDIAQIQAFEVVGEVIPLAVYGRVIGGALDGLPVVTKGGLIGTEVTAEACMNQLRALAESRFETPA